MKNEREREKKKRERTSKLELRLIYFSFQSESLLLFLTKSSLLHLFIFSLPQILTYTFLSLSLHTLYPYLFLASPFSIHTFLPLSILPYPSLLPFPTYIPRSFPYTYPSLLSLILYPHSLHPSLLPWLTNTALAHLSPWAKVMRQCDLKV